MNPKVSVCLITYNHEKYLAQSIEGIIAQKCKEPFEIIIGEDKSTDETATIVENYRKKYPDLIRVVTSEKNVGMVENWRRTIFASKGEYVAIIEGDDFWNSKSKLQQQVDLLDANPKHAICFHDVDVIFEDGAPQIDTVARFPGRTEFSIADVITKSWFIPTCSMLIRKSMLPDFPKWTKTTQAIDMVVHLLASNNGSIGYINEKMGTYRIHNNGHSQSHWQGKKNVFLFTAVHIFKNFDAYSKGKYKAYINERLENAYKSLLSQNSPWSYYHFKALFGLIALNPIKNISLLKAWFIINCIPSNAYKIYMRFKKNIIRF